MKLNKVLVDPLLEKKNILPKFAHTLKFNHWSPTSLSLGDGPFIFRYLVLTQEERRMLPANDIPIPPRVGTTEKCALLGVALDHYLAAGCCPAIDHL